MAATNASKLAGAKKEVVVDSKEIVSDLKELVEDSVEFLEDSVELVKKSWIVRSNPKVVALSASLVGVVVGSALTYLVASKRLSKKYALLSEKEIAEAKTYYAAVYKKDEFATPGDALEQLADQIIDEEGYGSAAVETEIVDGQEVRVTTTLTEQTAKQKPKSEDKNIFTHNHTDDFWDYDTELASRGDEPYVIHHDEYMHLRDEGTGEYIDYEQVAFTYYEGDGTLADAREEAVPNSDELVGDDNLMKFGHGSNDPNVVYVRNESIETDFEIVRHDGKFSVIVLGFDDTSLSHSDQRIRRNRKAWSADE